MCDVHKMILSESGLRPDVAWTVRRARTAVLTADKTPALLDEHAVAVRVEAIAGIDGVAVGAHHQIGSRQG